MRTFDSNHWALILGGSSGFGLATAKKLSSHGLSVCIVHRDRRGAMARINEEFETIKQHGHGFIALNLDALSDDGRTRVDNALKDTGWPELIAYETRHRLVKDGFKLVFQRS